MFCNDITPVVFPDDFPFKREFRTAFYKDESFELSDQQKSQYDFDTLFYDVFLGPENDVLHFIGPPLLNLHKELPRCLVKLGKVQRILDLTDLLKGRIVHGTVELDEKVLEPLTVEIGVRNLFSHSVAVVPHTVRRNRRVLSTIQKDNPISWIREWSQFYKNYHHIDRIVIYDNASSNRKELIREFEDDQIVEIVPWDSPYGIFESWGDQFCQIGALNHCRLKYGKGALVYNFDIDELLIYPPSKLDLRLRSGSLIQFGQVIVPHNVSLKEPYGYESFNQQLIPGSYRNQKYVYHGDRLHAAHVHYAETNANKVLIRMEKFSFKVVQSLAKRFPIFEKWVHLLSYQLVSLDEGYFFHFRGMSSHKMRNDKGDLVPLSLEKIVHKVFELSMPDTCQIR